ncbi:MAG TPA: hypothetical protein PK089_05230 [Methanoregulaceae archaeon]|nr:hypothetical protein [Methanoregulaceae archaeon]HQJ88285.1 hypothetical protein [Methanoregulaceae archaeon]
MHVLSLLIVILVASTAASAAALGVEGSPIEAVIDPGTTVNASIILVAGPSEPAQDCLVEVTGLAQSPFGAPYTPLPATGDTGPLTARPFIRVDRTSVHLHPGEQREVVVSVLVPPDHRDGGRYAAVRIRPGTGATGPPSGNEGDLVVPVLLTLRGGATTESGVISGLEVTTNRTDGQTEVATYFTCTGNHHITGATSIVSVLDAEGRTVHSARSNPHEGPIIPSGEVRFRVTIPGGVVPGRYSITARVEASDGTLLAEQHESIGVGEGEPPATSPVPAGPVPGARVAALVLALATGSACTLRQRHGARSCPAEIRG